ncbi:MAG TPA: 16S rRNA (cytosine(1402)-N(4))-methyltransferase [Aquificae bacterium]|nr:16S rRNA (cytosine(1402)-N(4))-methyltransferase [Aquificota bacterium]
MEKVYLSRYLKKKEVSQNDLNKYKDKYRQIFKKHPATKVFQALRIEVNKEFEVLKEALSKVSNFLKTYGRLGVITFHSLEDKMVKNILKEDPSMKLIDIFLPSQDEIKNNIASRSAKLRVYEKRY